MFVKMAKVLIKTRYNNNNNSNVDAVAKLLAEHDYIIDIQYGGWNPTLAVQQVRDWRFLAKTRELFAHIFHIYKVNIYLTMPIIILRVKLNIWDHSLSCGLCRVHSVFS